MVCIRSQKKMRWLYFAASPSKLYEECLLRCTAGQCHLVRYKNGFGQLPRVRFYCVGGRSRIFYCRAITGAK
jgi:hypothetical protein